MRARQSKLASALLGAIAAAIVYAPLAVAFTLGAERFGVGPITLGNAAALLVGWLIVEAALEAWRKAK